MVAITQELRVVSEEITLDDNVRYNSECRVVVAVVVVAVVVFALKGFDFSNLLRGKQLFDSQDDNARYTSVVVLASVREELVSEEIEKFLPPPPPARYIKGSNKNAVY